MPSGLPPRRSLPRIRVSAACRAVSSHSGGAAGMPTRRRPPKRPPSPWTATSTSESVGWKPSMYGSASASSAGLRKVIWEGVGDPDGLVDRRPDGLGDSLFFVMRRRSRA